MTAIGIRRMGQISDTVRRETREMISFMKLEVMPILVRSEKL